MADYSERLCKALRAGHQYTGITDPLDVAAAEYIETLKAALLSSVVAIDDWLNVYAAELCDDDRVKEAMKRIGEHGTIAYIALVQQQNMKALSGGAVEALCQRDGECEPTSDLGLSAA